MIEIIATGGLATIQDLGRRGALKWGVGTSGAMDDLAVAAGNILLGNPDDAAAIEVQIFPFRIRFQEDITFSVTGADCDARLDDLAILPWCVHRAGAGQVLQLGLPRRDGWAASRAYLCVAGGIDVPSVLGSRSTQLRGEFGGLEGRALRTGDKIATGLFRAAGARVGLNPPALAMPLMVDGLPAVRVLRAAEYEAYTPQAQASLWNEPWRISPQSDRYGFRLEGTPLMPKVPLELRSHGIVPGVIQVPHGGQPIVQMRDAQPSGGYPKIGTVIEADLWRLGQAPIGSRIRFVEATWAEAVAARDANERWLAEARRLVGLFHARRGGR
ncbi:biotin-dependent carboxyltransferase family protein [Bradyrhizobium genosp. A]|uniref:5-oxoprolinase subunit C family protein n=1 Tax=Bradyrhizobium genosp. A TaxID=83626 RepID=UPI003CF4AEFB